MTKDEELLKELEAAMSATHVGRPSSYLPEYTTQVRKLCLLGATDPDLADFFNVSLKTINNWKKSQPEFLHALKHSKKELDNKVERSLFERATGYEHRETKVHFDKEGKVSTYDVTKHYPPDATSMIFWLKNRQPDNWREKKVDEGATDNMVDALNNLADKLPD